MGTNQMGNIYKEEIKDMFQSIELFFDNFPRYPLYIQISNLANTTNTRKKQW